MFDFIESNITEIIARANRSLSSVEYTSSDKVFCYWAQGYNTAPPIVSACQRQLHKFVPKESIILVDDENINNFVKIPDHVKQKLNSRSAFFSDILRLLLLSRYGGTWIDSTCYLTAAIDTAPSPENDSFTAFKGGAPFTLSVWYLKSRNDSWIIHAWKEAMLMYWEYHDETLNYFVFHHVFEALYRIDQRFKNERDAVKQLNSSRPHDWYFNLSKDFDPEKYQEFCKSSNIHKLTYKTNFQMERPESFYSYAIRGF